MYTPTVFMLIGLPCSGKTTYRKKHLLNITPVSTDDYIIGKMHWHEISYKEAWELYYKKAEQWMYKAVGDLVQGRQSFVWDQTNLSRKSRLKKLALIPKEYRKVAITFPDPTFEEFQQRNAYRQNELSDKIFLDMRDATANFAKPLEDEGFDEIRYVHNI